LPVNGIPLTTCLSPEARSRIVFGQSIRVAKWCSERIEHFSGWGSNPEAVGYEIDGVLKGGVVYTNYTPTNVFGSIVLEAPLTKKYLHTLFAVPFLQWKLPHLSAAVEASNEKSVHMCHRWGFTVEGRLREAAADGKDVIIFGMLRRECRFI
jgi:hypothetical protein